MVITGLSDVIGSWNTIAMSLPRTCRISSSLSFSRSLPMNLMLPPTTRPGGSATRRRMDRALTDLPQPDRSEEHTSELQSLMRISYDVFCLNKTNIHNDTTNKTYIYTQTITTDD